MILVDSDWVMDFLRDDDLAVRLVASLRHHGLAISVVSFGEIYEGVISSREPVTAAQRFALFAAECEVLALDIECARLYGSIRADLRSRGAIIGDNDLHIAATAIRYGLPLATRNHRHFTRIPGLRLHLIDEDRG